MDSRTRNLGRSHESGVALLIALIVLLLVSAVALSLIMSSGTESSLASNYRSSTTAYYAALAGIEEARGRLVASNPDYFNNTVANFIPTAGLTVTPKQVRYILNPAPGEVVAPTTATNQYFDNEYQQEWGWSVTTATAQTIASVSSVPAGDQGPMFKWVRITPATEQSINLDVDNRVLPLDNATALFYDSAHVNAAGAADPSLIVSANPPTTGEQAYEIAALAVLPNGTKKMLEYVVTPITFNLNLTSALSMPGTVGSFSGGNSANYQIDGVDGQGSAPAVPGCTANSPGGPAVSVASSTSATTVQQGFPRPAKYTGNDCSYYGGGNGCVGNQTLPSSMSTPASLTQTLTNIEDNANACLGCAGAGGGTYSFSNISRPCRAAVGPIRRITHRSFM